MCEMNFKKKTTPTWKEPMTTMPNWEEETTIYEPSWKENMKTSTPSWKMSTRKPTCDNDCKGDNHDDNDVCSINIQHGKYKIHKYNNACKAKCAGEVNSICDIFRN